MAESNQGSQGSAFVSYSRKDKVFVQKLNDALDNAGIQAWVDWEGIELASDWMERITNAIKTHDAFIFVISPDSIKSKVCADELELGISLNKKLIPILYREPKEGQKLHEKLAATNWVYLRKQDNFGETIPKLVEAIQTDLEWISKSTQLLNQALEWESKDKNNSFLLQGTQLDDAEKWLADASGKENRQTLPLQADYIRASRQAAHRRQRMVMVGISLALVVSIALSIFALIARSDAQKAEATAIVNQHLASTAQAVAEDNQHKAVESQKQAEENQKKAEASERLAVASRSAAEAQNLQSRAGKLDISTLLAIESYNINKTIEAENLIRSNSSLASTPINQMKQDGAIWNIEWSPDYSYFVTGNNQDSAIENAKSEACVYQALDGIRLYCVSHSSDINDAIFSKDGKYLITASADQTVKFWDAANGDFVKELVFGGAVLDLDASPLVIAIARADNFLTLYYMDKPDLKPVDVEQVDGVRSVKFAPNGDFLAFGLLNGRLRFWQRRSNAFYNGPIHERSSYVVLAWSPDSNWVVSGGGDSLAMLTRRDGTFQYAVNHGDWVEGVAFGPDPSWFVTASDDNKIRVVDTEKGFELRRMSHTNFAQKVIVSPDGQWIASTGYDRVVRIWDSVSGTQVSEIPLKANGSAVSFNQDDSRVVVADEDGNVSIWDISQLKARIGYIKFTEFVREARFTPSGESLIVNADDYNVWKIPADQVNQITDGTKGKVIFTANSLTYETAISADSKWVAVAELDTEDVQKNRGTLISIDGETHTPLEHGGEVTDIDFSNDNSLVATSGADGKIVFWDVQSGKRKFELDNLEPVNSMAISPTTSMVAAGLHDTIKIWDWSTKEEITQLAQQGDIVTVAFSSDGKMIATGSSDGSVAIWKIDDTTFTQTGDTIYISGARRMLLAFSPDNMTLAGGSLGFAYLWDTTTAQEFARIPHGSNPVTSVSFTIDGKQLLTVSRKVVRIWDLSAVAHVPNDQLITYACSHTTSNFSPEEWANYFGNAEYRYTCPNLMEKE